VGEAQFRALVGSLRAGLERVEAVAGAIPADSWDQVIQTGDGAWTRRQLLAHMAANDLRQVVRIRVGAGIAEPGDEAEHAAELETHDWNAARVAEREGRTIAQLLAEMRSNRSALIALLEALTTDQRSRHMPFRGTPTPLEEMIPLLLGHLDAHARDLAKDDSGSPLR
jgi:hypothetical protein